MDEQYMTTNVDYQGRALFGSAENPSILNAQTLNPYADSPNDWLTILTNGISSAAVVGINGAVNNAVVSGQIQNAGQAQQLGLTRGGSHGNMMPLIFGAALLYFFLK